MSTNEELALQYQAGNEAALLPLWDQVYGLAYTIASSYTETMRSNPAVDLDDLLQASFLGVEAAARRYDPNRSAFTTYASLYIRRHCREALGLIGRPRLEHYNATRLDASLGNGDGETTLGDLLEDPNTEPMGGALLEEDIAHHVRSAVASLPQAEAEAVARHWLDGDSYQQIMADLGITRPTLQRLLRLGLQRLSKQRSLRDLAEAYCYNHVSLKTFKSSNMSATERAVLLRLGLLHYFDP